MNRSREPANSDAIRLVIDLKAGRDSDSKAATWPGHGLTAGYVMSGRRSLIKGYFWRCAGRGCGHVFGLSRGRIGSAGHDVVR